MSADHAALIVAIEAVSTRSTDGWWRTVCPIHGSKDRNLAWKVEDGELKTKCWSHDCDRFDIVAALGYSRDAIYAERHSTNGTAGRSVPPPVDDREATRRPYRREPDHLVYEVGGCWHVRRPTPAGEKKPPMFWVDPSTMTLGLPNGVSVTDLPLYRDEDIDSFDRSRPVYVNEGEKATDACRAAGLQAVGTATGASTVPSQAVSARLAGFEVVLIPDHDRSGADHMTEVGRRLVGVASGIYIYAHEDDAPEHHDMADILWPGASAHDLHEMASHPMPTVEVKEALKAVEQRRVPWVAPDGMAPLSRIEFRPPRPLLLGMIGGNGEFTILNGHGGAGKGLTGCWLAGRAIAEGLKPAIIDFEGRLDEWGSRTRSLGIDMDLVLYINRDRMPLGIRGLSILEKSMADYIAVEMDRYGVGVYLLDNIITALLVGEEQMKSDALLPWRYRDVVEGWDVPGASLAHPPRGRTDGDPYGSVMWSAASRFLWHGTAASGASRGEHHTRWRLHKANTRRKPDPFLIVTTFAQSGDEMPLDIEYRSDNLATGDWLKSVMGTHIWTVDDLTDLMLEDEDSVSATKTEQAKERIRKALSTGEKRGDSTNAGQRGRGRAGKWSLTIEGASKG